MQLDRKGWMFISLMSAVFAILIAALWLYMFQFWRTREDSTVQTWMNREYEGIQRLAHVVEIWLRLRIDEQGMTHSEAEEEIRRVFFASQHALPGSHTWIYYGNHFLIDEPQEFPGEYRGLSIDEVFTRQAEKGAEHYETILRSIKEGGDGYGWYIWEAGEDQFYAAWKSIRRDDGIWTVGSTTPRAAILAIPEQIRSYQFEISAALIATLLLLFGYFLGFRNWWLHQQRLKRAQDESQTFLQRLMSTEETLERYAFIVNTTTQMMSLINRAYQFEAVNDAYCYNHGLSREKILGKFIWDVWGAESYNENIRTNVERCFAGEDVHYEAWFTFQPDQDVRYYEVFMFPYMSDGMEISHVVTITQDVTGEMLSEREMQRSVYIILFLNRLIETVSSTMDLDLILFNICEELSDALNLPRVSFAILDETGDKLHISAEYYLEDLPSHMDAVIPLRRQTQLRTAIAHNRPLTLFDVNLENLFQKHEITPSGNPTPGDPAPGRSPGSMLCVPLYMHSQAYGVLALDSHDLREFSADEIALVQSVAAITGNALENARLYNALSVSNNELVDALASLAVRNRLMDMLHEMSAALQTCLAIQEAFPIVEQFGQKILEGTSGVIYFVTEEAYHLTKVVNWGEQQIGHKEIDPRACAAYVRSMDIRQPAFISACQCASGPNGEADHICLTLYALGNILGIMQIAGAPEPLSDEWEHRIHAFAERISLALGNLRLRHILQTQSIQDPLTGLYNRRFLNEALQHEIQRALRHKRSFGILMIDIDFFKVVNDTYGHEAGDEVLRSLSRFLKAHVRAEDIACRYGGEEFLILVSETGLEETAIRGEELLQGIRELRVPYEGNVLTIRASAGVSAFPRHGQTPEAVIQAADRALLQAKRSGRDRVVAAESPANDEPRA